MKKTIVIIMVVGLILASGWVRHAEKKREITILDVIETGNDILTSGLTQNCQMVALHTWKCPTEEITKLP